MLEMDLAIDQNPQYYDHGAAASLFQAKPIVQTLSSEKVPCCTNYAIGVYQNDAFHLTPVHNIVQMRPQFPHLEADTSMEDDDDMSDFIVNDLEEPKREPEMKPVRSTVMKRETEEAIAARKSTFAYQRSQKNAEKWLNLNVCTKVDSTEIADKLICDETTEIRVDRMMYHPQNWTTLPSEPMEGADLDPVEQKLENLLRLEKVVDFACAQREVPTADPESIKQILLALSVEMDGLFCFIGRSEEERTVRTAVLRFVRHAHIVMADIVHSLRRVLVLVESASKRPQGYRRKRSSPF